MEIRFYLFLRANETCRLEENGADHLKRSERQLPACCRGDDVSEKQGVEAAECDVRIMWQMKVSSHMSKGTKAREQRR